MPEGVFAPEKFLNLKFEAVGLQKFQLEKDSTYEEDNF